MPYKKIADSRIQKMNRNFMVAKIFLLMTPVICYFYISLKATMNGFDVRQILTHEPQMTIVFLTAMVNPYIVYLLHLIQKKLPQENKTFVCINMLLLLIAEVLMLNIFYFIILAYTFYYAIKYYDIPIFSTLTTLRMKEFFFHAGGSLFVMLISSICLFATMRLL